MTRRRVPEGLRGAAGLLSPLAPASARLTPEALVWFPVVGAALGAMTGLGWRALARRMPAPVAAGGVVALDLALTGMLHVDGLLDSADGLFAPHVGRDRRLEILRDHHVGAFGVAAGVVGIGLRWSALTYASPSVRLLAGLGALSRSVMAGAVCTLPYVREGGMASELQGGPGGRAMLAGLGGVLGGALLVASARSERPGTGRWASAALALLGGVAVLGLARRRLGGYTGDVLGAAGWTAETAGLVAASWR